MHFQYTEIERVETISKEKFKKEYFNKHKPLIVSKLTKDWDAYEKWNFDYIKQIAGEKIVPLFNNDPVDYSKKINEPIAKMKMSEYIDILHQGPTELRIFLYNIMKEVPTLQDDFSYPDLGVRFLKEFPMLFFGGEGSNVFMHYDIDFANIFHFHFAGKKQCVLVPQEQSKYMYRLPYNWIMREDIDFGNPDFEKFPALKKVRPLVANLEHGEMLFMPEGYWHYMQYITPGFSMSLRALAHNPIHLYKGLRNLFILRHFDNIMRKMGGQKWIDYKDKKAYENTHKYL